MHAGQVDVGVDVVRALVAAQHPAWASDDVVRVGDGTVNAVFRVGRGVSARFPLRGAPDDVARELAAEARTLDAFTTASPFTSPRPLAMGAPGSGHPLPWALWTWVDGRVATPGGSASSDALAADVVRLVAALRSTAVGPRFTGSSRGGLLRDHDDWVVECIGRNAPWFPPERTRLLWSRLRELPRPATQAMVHGDLIPSNLLLGDDGRLVGVLDAGGFGAADPALDLVAAWHLFDATRREQVRLGLDVGDAQWLRGAGWAFQQAMGLVWYYDATNPTMAELGRTTLRRLLEDPGLAATLPA